MTPMSLVGAASYLPDTVVDNSFFGIDESERSSAMFRGTKVRRHVRRDESVVDMIAGAALSLQDRLGIRLDRDVDVLLTNVSCPDLAFAGDGAPVAKRLGIKAQTVIDLHNAGCVSFVYMMSVARAIMSTTGAKTALVCNVQNAAGRVFAHADNRGLPQSAIPGDGCGVGYFVANDESPVRSIVTRCYPEFSEDMQVVYDDKRFWWEPGPTQGHVDFSEQRIVKVLSRGSKLVPEVVRDALRAAELGGAGIDVLVTNQPNAFFLRIWREALGVDKRAHVDTFEEHGNLFGAALPIGIERALLDGTLRDNHVLALGGFSHAGDYAAAAIVHWRPR